MITMCLVRVINIDMRMVSIMSYLHNRERMIFIMKQKLPVRFCCGLGN